MTRDEIIEILTARDVRFCEENNDYLSDSFYFGFKGYANYTNQELEEDFKKIEEPNLKKIKAWMKEMGANNDG